ncbi:AAA-like domain-containing protein [Iningainema tapete]|uniref:GUN4 domain-containing protein n=1 Tax=Iningainema tapete BLCC-T55 TaxID=2748662 RepID=A0A8J6XK36_9CYAN|nr:AAA-like domain-containing protein [Iningainema tapete]MBD2772296.1 GUN4 domain-containing protein [Iningainema tapete BLCC-T55]
MFDEYIFSGSLPENASTYVKRSADDELYELLTDLKFCYVLNSRQSGKSSLRVRTMSRLTDAGVVCASIDLSSVSIQSATQENWYADLIVKLIDSFDLDIDFPSWWEKNLLNSSLWRFGNFIEKILLAEIQENIVIFIDEIDSVLSLNFPTDDFFAFIRSCYNLRVDNPEYNRLTFCLLGVASPSNLIADKKRTPFNIGKAISLKGFQLEEVEPLEKGLRGKYSHPHAVMQDILEWTGGQPFLTQKLCQFMVEESEQENLRSVEQVVRSRIIENWESLDEPEHLRTIRDRILRDEQRAGYLLELYQHIRREEKAEVPADDTLEQSELQLSGLVVRQQNKLRVYNHIYREIFDQNWIETQLRNLRPYSENLRFWVASGSKDESRLLRGKALQDALSWACDKSLNYQDREFLAASQAKEKEEAIAILEKEAQLERERKDREAVEKRNLVLSEANKKAQQRMRIGGIVLAVTLSIAGTLGVLAYRSGKQLITTQQYLQNVGKLAELAGKLKDKGFYDEAKELLSQAGQSVNIQDDNLKQDILHTGMAYAYLKLKEPNWKQEVENSLKNVKLKNENSDESLQIQILTYKTQSNFQKEKQENTEAINSYKKAFNSLKDLKKKTSIISPPFNENIPIDKKILSKEVVEALHREFIDLLSNNNNENSSLKHEVEDSLKEHFYNELANLLKNKQLKQAHEKTASLMLYIARRENEEYFDKESINKFSCSDLRRIDQYWVENSQGRFGFSVQKKILTQELGIRDLKNISEQEYQRFATIVGWYNEERDSLEAKEVRGESGWRRYSELNFSMGAVEGHLPIPTFGDGWMLVVLISDRATRCQL